MTARSTINHPNEAGPDVCNHVQPQKGDTALSPTTCILPWADRLGPEGSALLADAFRVARSELSGPSVTPTELCRSVFLFVRGLKVSGGSSHAAPILDVLRSEREHAITFAAGIIAAGSLPLSELPEGAWARLTRVALALEGAELRVLAARAGGAS